MTLHRRTRAGAGDGAGTVCPVDGHQTPAPDRNGDVAIPVGTQRRHSELSQRGQQARRRMAVVVVRAHADHRDPGACRSQERGLEVPAAVMGHLQHIRTQIDT